MTLLPSEARYSQYDQIQGCTVPEISQRGSLNIVPACLGGVGMQGCVRQSECKEIVWDAKGSEDIASRLAELHKPSTLTVEITGGVL